MQQRTEPRPPTLPAAGPAGAATMQQADLSGLHDAVKANIHPRLERLEEIRGHKVISYFLDEGAQLADEQVLHLYEHLRRIGKQERLSFWLFSRGGATEVPWKIVSLIREYMKSFSVLVPYRAHSAATHIALGADEIVMTEMSELGPVDPSRRHPLLPQEEREGEKAPIPISVQDLRHVLKFLEREMGKDLTPEAAATVYTALFDKVHPLAIGALEQSWALAEQISERVLSTHMDDSGEIQKIVNRFSDYYKSHLYQITRREAKEIGLKVTDASEEEAAAMWDLYLAYNGLQIQGEGQLEGEPAIVARLGHIDSTAGTTLGLGLAKKSQPTKVAARWESRWLAGVAEPQAVAQAEAQVAEAAERPGSPDD